MHCHGRNLHYVADVEQVKPLGLIEVAQDRFHVQPGLCLVQADRLKLLISTSAV